MADEKNKKQNEGGIRVVLNRKPKLDKTKERLWLEVQNTGGGNTDGARQTV